MSSAEHFAKLLGHAADPSAAHAELAGPPLALSLHTADDQLLYLDMVQTAALLHGLNLLKPERALDETLIVLDRLRDLALSADWQDDHSTVELQLRMR